jgi:putative ABC transport system permease protein
MKASLLPPLLGAVGTLLLVVGWQVVKRPMLRRFAGRDVMRRPAESALVVAGSLLGTALIAGSFIVGDTLDASFKQRAWTQLGPIDEVITVPDGRHGEKVVRLITSAKEPLIDGVMSMTTTSAAIVTEASGEKLAEPRAQIIELDFDKGRNFGSNPEVTGISGPTPESGEVVITDDLAEHIEAGGGDDVTAHLYGRRVELTVDRVVAQEGVAGFWTGLESRSPNAFVAPGTITSIAGDAAVADAAAPLVQVVVSNRGGVEEGAAYSETVRRSIDDVLPPTGSVRVATVKQDALDAADAAGDGLVSAFLTFGMFAVIAGVLLLVNIFVMLAEERKGQLGMMRAVGMRRSDLVRIFFIEGAIYSVAAGVVGAIAGIGVGWAIVKVAAPIFSSLGDTSLDLRFNAEPASVVGGVCIGLLISIATIVLTSVRISRINVIRAIRDLPEPTGGTVRLHWIIMGSVVAAGAATWFVAALGDMTAWAPALLGPPLIAFGLLPLAGRLFGRRKAVLAAATAALAWGVLGNGILGGQVGETGDLTAFVFQGVLLVFSAVVLLTQLQENLEGAVRKIAAGRLSLRLGLAYPLARRVRTGLTLGMYSLVIFTLVMVGVLSNVFAGQVERTTKEEAGGFEILVTAGASNPPTARRMEAVDGVDRVVATNFGLPLFESERVERQTAWPATGITDEFTGAGAPGLMEYSARFDTEHEVWDAVAANDDVVIVPEEFLQPGGPPQRLVTVGDRLTVVDPLTGRSVEREVIGLTQNDEARSGAYMSFESLDGALGGRATPSRFYVDASGSTAEVDGTAAALEAKLAANGVEARSFRRIVEEGLSTTLQFIRLMQGYLALGLIVGIAGLGVVMVRAVRDRRREIGVLRALGLVPRRVRSAFLLESAFVTLEGILIGSSLALVTASQLIAQGDFGDGVAFSVPWMQLVAVCGVALLASLLAAARPAQKASAIPPAVAVRVIG